VVVVAGSAVSSHAVNRLFPSLAALVAKLVFFFLLSRGRCGDRDAHRIPLVSEKVVPSFRIILGDLSLGHWLTPAFG
jgi:hypothetical protein